MKNNKPYIHYKIRVSKYLIYFICITLFFCCFSGCTETGGSVGSAGSDVSPQKPENIQTIGNQQSHKGQQLNDNQQPEDSLKVVTTLFASYDFVRQITEGTDVELQMLIKPGAESHSFDPTAQDIINIRDCDLFIYTGGENDGWIENILDSFDKDVNTLRMMDFTVLVEEETKEGMYTPKFSSHDHAHTDEHKEFEYESDSHIHEYENDFHTDEPGENLEEHEHHGGDGEWDEHVWTSPLNAVNIIKGISSELSKLQPENETLYSENAQKYIHEIHLLDEQIRELTENAEANTLIFADRFPVRYFTEEFGLDYYAAFPGCSAEAEPSAATVAFLIDKVKEENIPAVFYMEMSDEKMADAVCESTGAKKLRFHSCHNVTKTDFDSKETYLSLMYQNLENLKQAIN